MNTASYVITRRSETVTLAAPVEWFSKTITEVEIREPSAAMYFEIGAPQIIVHTPNGGGSLVDVPAALNAYVERCVKVEQADRFLQLLPLSDGRAIKKVLLSFFRDAVEETSS